MTKKHKTFTLIEMLIVVVIIGILAAALVPRLQAVQARARDSKRKVDIRSVYNANEIYRLDYGLYPQPVNSVITCSYEQNCYVDSKDTPVWLAPLSGIMASLPLDPINNLGNVYVTGNYAYEYGNSLSGAQSYDLHTQLENRNDPDRCAVKLYINAW